MLILYYSPAFENEALYGGSVIRKRNLNLLRGLAGKENVEFFIHRDPSSRTGRRRINLTKLIGADFCADKDLAQSIKKADVLFIDGSLHGAFSTSVLRGHKVISFFHNVEYDYYCQEHKQVQGIPNQLKTEYRKTALFQYEKRICRYSDVIITLNERDSNRLRELYGRGADLILPTSMDDSYTEDANKSTEQADSCPYLLFVGSDFYGNTEGLFWFCEQCMPSINASLIIAGKGMDKYKGKYSSDKIQFHGYVDDLASLYRNAAAVVLPIISGSGMKTKTCEAMMYGKVIFGTGESFEGYQLSEDCILCEKDTDFIEKVNRYLEGSPRYFSSENRKLYLENYESSVVVQRFYDFFSKVKL